MSKPWLDFWCWSIHLISGRVANTSFLFEAMVIPQPIFKVQAFPTMDWRFSEFPNEGAHGLYVTCVELMILNMDPVAVGERLVDVILENSCHIPGKTCFTFYFFTLFD